jgi:hypothetical protein
MFSVRGTSTTRFTASSASATAFTFQINFLYIFFTGLECVGMFSVRGTSTTRFTASSASATAFTIKKILYIFFVGYKILYIPWRNIFLLISEYEDFKYAFTE